MEGYPHSTVKTEMCACCMGVIQWSNIPVCIVNAWHSMRIK